MMDNPGLYSLGDFAIAAAGTQIGDVIDDLAGVSEIDVQLRLAYGSGGASIKAFLQTSLDQGTTWNDLWCFAGATASKVRARRLKPDGVEQTPTDGALADDTAATGIVLGDRVRLKVVSTGTYAGSTVLSARVHAR